MNVLKEKKGQYCCCCCYCSGVNWVLIVATPWTAACQAALPSLSPKLMSIELVTISKHLILCCPLLLLLSIFLFIRVLSNKSALCTRWPKYWSFSFSISPFSEYSGLISFRIDWFDLQGTLKTLLQYHSLKASILWCSAFFTVCLLYGPALTTVRDHWEDHSLDYIDLYRQISLCFSAHCLGLSSLSCQEAVF